MAGDASHPAADTGRKTGERVHFLFAVRASRISKNYINDTIIPALCRKADIPATDVRGPITSHRARSTIARRVGRQRQTRAPSSRPRCAALSANLLSEAGASSCWPRGLISVR